MITIAAVTMFFLPGTFISVRLLCKPLQTITNSLQAVFSMTFFNFQEDNTGNQQFQVSEKWWYFLAATIPLTIAVFLVWITWQKWRFRTLAEEDKKGFETLR
jgi:surface polysaccharide O-acyltransferase-like enzyme